MEHNIIFNSLSELGYTIDDEKAECLSKYAEMIYKGNKSIGLSGHKDHNLIINDLIINSLEPLLNINVPRGTLFGDLGTGSGIPGVPIAIIFSHIRGTLFDSNSKKVEFIKNVINELGLSNVDALCERIEEVGHNQQYREHFDLLFSRAFNDIYVTFELAAPLLKEEGILFVYSAKPYDSLSADIRKHAELLGLSLCHENQSDYYGLNNKGILLKKTMATDSKYPRRFPVIQRESRKILNKTMIGE